MEFAEAKNNIIRLTDELNVNKAEYKELNKMYVEVREKMNVCLYKKQQLSKEIKKFEEIIETEHIFETVKGLKGFDALLEKELLAISSGMDKTDYRKYGNYPRWYDLQRIVDEVITFKKLYPGWILEQIDKIGAYDIVPPNSFYRYTYKSPNGHSMSMGGMND